MPNILPRPGTVPADSQRDEWTDGYAGSAIPTS